MESDIPASEDSRKRARESISRIAEFRKAQILPNSQDAEPSRDDQPTENREVADDNELFVSQSPAPKRIRRIPLLNNAEVRESIAVGTASYYSSHKGSGPRNAFRSLNPKGGTASRKEKLKSKANEIDFETLFRSDIITDGQAIAGLQPIPTSTLGNKAKALAELLASIPTSDREEAKPDKQAILEATRKFERMIRSDKAGGWKHPSLKTSLYHHQLLGAAYMRTREKSPEMPRGGMLCDVMGLGKTIQTLANIVDGERVSLDDNANTTLIVVPRALIDHWKVQISTHVEDGVLRVLYCHAGSRFEASDMVDTILRSNVILASYDEIRRSYPRIAKSDSMDDKQAQLLIEQEYKKKAGPFHQIRFRRIILDEGHLIRNPESQVSIAIRALHAHYKWVLSGTPLLNHTGELWAYFNFLGVPHIGKFANFIKNYCDGSDIANQRVVNIIRAVVFRRTLKARLFSRPIVILPEIAEVTETLEPSLIEEALYNMVATQFIDTFNSMAGTEEQVGQNRCFLTMLMRLRMCNSHPLIIQEILKLILRKDRNGEDKNMKKLVDLVPEDADPEDPDRLSVSLLQGLRQLGNGINTHPTTLDGPLNARFQKFVYDLKSAGNHEEYDARSRCVLCDGIPTQTKVTPCMHLICEECLLALRENSSDNSGGAPVMCPAGCDIEVVGEESHTMSPGILSSSFKTVGARGRSHAIDIILGNCTAKENDNDIDWVRNAGGEMPSTKVTAARRIIHKWVTETKEDVPSARNKIVIFTQFRDMVTIFEFMCQQEKWRSCRLTGDMTFPSRKESIKEFAKETGPQVMIASLKAGGIGLDLTMANKCILIEPWWNDAMQQQAFCRLFRIGQQRKVQIVKLIMKNTIDTYMTDMQSEKNAEIDGAMGEMALAGRNTSKEVLEMFGEVECLQGGGLRVNRRRE
ncbi:SNF2 family N-terminal domain-containing protein [Talaromyces proteolyticus]|uniref:SNF2 family N-terminal domain-containing protein n=1 Tax=Talaromyces proteolyticus TaxID=1131652 RepID=A0AAD4L2K3_9EURO|nr:SNF2 family N-terminal domain-containing protein [Talaromyces proteolyticus]KAH8705435.1 SNF2 family N-terminal domain-containing protein [Talaromyces proteolyticus]